MTELLLGDEAVALAALDAGIAGAFSYPGTPATEIMECIQERTAGGNGTSARWSPNEKVAYEEALGMSYVGRRALTAMKHVGLNVAADPFMSSALTGALGGLVLAVADDPGMHSSQNEQDSRFYGEFARIPIFEPANQQEAYDMTREAFELSERVGLPVMVRLVTRLAHSRAIVTRSAPAKASTGERRRAEPRDWTLLPVNARRRFRRLIDVQSTLHDHSERSVHNRLVVQGPKGILASGVGYNYVREAIGGDSGYSVLQVGVYPIPGGLLRKFVDHCERILVVEEGYPFIESRLNGLLGLPGRVVEGKCSGALPPDGELSSELVRRALGLPQREARDPLSGLPNRPPALCSGCPHCDTFRLITDALGAPADPILFSDIGCYTLGALPPYNAVHSCVDMGASISMAHGAAKAGAHPVLCTIGDSTFTHSGMAPLLGAAHENANITVIILDNATVAMTGGQEAFVTGEDFVRLICGLGVDPQHVIRFEPLRKDHAKNVEMLRREIVETQRTLASRLIEREEPA